MNHVGSQLGRPKPQERITIHHVTVPVYPRLWVGSLLVAHRTPFVNRLAGFPLIRMSRLRAVNPDRFFSLAIAESLVNCVPDPDAYSLGHGVDFLAREFAVGIHVKAAKLGFEAFGDRKTIGIQALARARASRWLPAGPSRLRRRPP